MKKNIWKHYNQNQVLPRQGFKLHISAHPQNLIQITKIIKPHLLNKNIPFKIIKSQDDLIQLNSGLLGLTQVGKAITIYPKRNEIKKLALDLAKKLESFNSPIITSDLPVKKESIVYYRYGIINPKDEKLNYLLTPTGEYIKETRLQKDAIPNWEKPIFKIEQSTDESLLKDLIITNTLRVRGRGSVFKGLYKSNSIKKVIIKEARPFGEYISENNNGRKRINNESKVLQELSHLNCTPTFIEVREKNNHILSIQEQLDGFTIKDLINQKIKIEKEHLIKILVESLKNLNKIHSLNITHNDLTPDNILIGDSLYFIDFEFASLLNTNKTNDFHSFGFKLNTNKRIQNDIYCAIKSILCLNNQSWYKELQNNNSSEFFIDDTDLMAIYNMGKKLNINQILTYIETNHGHRKN